MSATGDRMGDIARRAVDQCIEHGAESAVMLVTWRDGSVSHLYRWSQGNWYANRGACYDYLNQQSAEPEDKP